VRITKDLDENIEGAHVLIVEDIIDTGLTLNYLLGVLRARGPASLEVAVLLDRDQRRIVDMPISYRGFHMPDAFCVGYGLDLSGRHRNLRYVGTLRDEVLERMGVV
jgi:hypoxanthine phosphoribosyltransferase